MKLKYNFIINQVAGQYVAVPAGMAGDFNGMIKLNDTGAFIFGLLKEDITLEAVIEKTAKEYNCDIEEAKKSVENIIGQCKQAGLLED